ncbi:hypothetical protein VTJ04DRAFT_8380 [Mycothermus thermophilus]|uniref:uncharacterized protein n=1 Tax=Humicola insolens TaxID=85995 RepID=UPI003743E031
MATVTVLFADEMATRMNDKKGNRSRFPILRQLGKISRKVDVAGQNTWPQVTGDMARQQNRKCNKKRKMPPFPPHQAPVQATSRTRTQLG